MLRPFQLPGNRAKLHSCPSADTLIIGSLKSRRRKIQLLYAAPLAILVVTFGVAAATQAQSDSGNVRMQIVAEPIAYVLPEIKSLPGEDTTALLQINPRIEWDRISLFASRIITQPELRSDIATLFNFRWQPDKNAAKRVTLVLEMPPGERILEQKFWRQTMDRAIKPVSDLGK